MMRWIDSCRLYPGTCAVLPQLGGTHELGYLDTARTTPAGERVYVSVVAVQQMAESLGLGRAAGTATEAANRKLRARVEELQGLVVERDEQLAAVGTLKLAGATRAPGRPAGGTRKTKAAA